MNDEQAKKEYYRSFVDNGLRTTYKESLVDKLSTVTHKPKTYWAKVKPKNLLAIIKQYEKPTAVH